MKKDFYLIPHVFSVILKRSVGNFHFRDSSRKIKINIGREFVENDTQACEKNSGWRKELLYPNE